MNGLGGSGLLNWVEGLPGFGPEALLVQLAGAGSALAIALRRAYIMHRRRMQMRDLGIRQGPNHPRR